MAIRTGKSVFYHIPKTGGIWVKQAIRRSGVGYDRCRNISKMGHPFGLKREHATPDVIVSEHRDDLFSFCFVRHPIGWYRSFWAYRVVTQIDDAKSPIYKEWDESFEQFVINALDAYPEGYVTQLYKFYIEAEAGPLDFIGRQEQLADDLVRALSLAGEAFNEYALRATKQHNVAAGHACLGSLCVMSDETRERLLGTEKWIIENFYEHDRVFAQEI